MLSIMNKNFTFLKPDFPTKKKKNRIKKSVPFLEILLQ